MLGFNKAPKSKPSSYYMMSMCLHVIAFVLLGIGTFTPFWASVREQIGVSNNNNVFHRGLIVSCVDSSFTGCTTANDATNFSGIFRAAYVLGILTVIMAFLVLQMMILGACIRGCQETNLAIPLAAFSMSLGFILIIVLILFEISLTHDVTTGNRFRESTFGMSRGLVVLALVIYLISALLLIGEYFRRRQAIPYRDINESEKRSRRPMPPPPARAQPDYKSQAPAVVVNPVYAAAGARRSPPPKYSDRRSSNGSSAGTYPCGRPECKMCGYLLHTSVFWGAAGVFSIREKISCQDSNVVYAILSNREADRMVFIGHSKPRLEDTFSRHLDNIRSRDSRDPVAVYFNKPGRSLQDVRILPLATIDCDYDTRYRLENALSYMMINPRNSYYGLSKEFIFL